MRRMLCALLALTLVVSLPLTALAAVDANVSYGNVTIGDSTVKHTKEENGTEVEENHGGEVNVSGSSEEYEVIVEAGEKETPVDVNIKIETEANSTTNVVLKDAHIHDKNDAGAPVEITGPGDVVVELEGSNSLIGNASPGLATSQEGGSLTIQDGDGDGVGKLTAQGGGWGGAGIGGDYGGNGSNITINSGEIEATGGYGAAGIGGSVGGNGSNITINGGTVTATGGQYGAGIGGGYNGDGSNITINGGKVTATGGSNAAGIGGGDGGDGSNITISGDANVTATGQGDAADIGDGNFYNGVEQENDVNTDKLLTTGSITYSNGVTVHGTYVPPVPPEKPAPSTPSAEPEKPAWSTQSGAAAPTKTSRGPATSGYKKGCLWSKGYITRTLFKVENGAGMKPVWSEEIKEGILTISAENEPVVFTTWLNGLKYLQEMGVKTILIRTEGWETELDVASLIAENAGEYILTQEGESATLTLDGKAAEIQ